MRIAVACDGLQIAPYFIQCTSYMVYDVNLGIVAESRNIPALDQPVQKLVDLFNEIGVDSVIVGRIEYDMAIVLCHAGIEVVAGAEGDALDAVRAYVTKTLTGISEPCQL